ncbi:TrwI protein [Bartonella australis AUST/NH1]|uniref:TrwI protein n=1 Tax=Bartonella australis (strain Aust/NH1) TaxID=1094489 RepID=M1P5F7_BARAA|nr:type IV secretion system protein [Bartonella australis]AGF75075.1 TrwI protein [Bartonella australis AUST/NH1]
MAFQLFTQLSSKIDQTTAAYVTDISSKAIAAITPVVSVGLSLAFILYGFLIIRGVIDMPIADFLNRYIRIGIITSIALTGGLYQKEIAELITTMPDELVSELISDTSNSDTMTRVIDKAAKKGFDRANEAFEESAFFDSNGLLYGIFGVIILLATSTLVAIGGALAFIILAKIALAILAGLGPLFIFALLWQPTYRFFEQWVTQMLNYVILIVLFATVFSVIMNIFGNYMNDLKFDGVQNVSYSLGGALILCITSVVLLLKLAGIAGNLAKGVTLGHMWLRQNMTSSYRGNRNARR